MEPGETWNESASYADPVTGRGVRRLTSRGRINMTPTYHTNSGFTADGRRLLCTSVRDGATWVLSAELPSGDLTALWRAPGIGDRSYLHRGMELSGPEVNGRGLCGNRVSVAPRSAQAVLAWERSLLAVGMQTLAVRALLEDCGEEWIFGAPAVDPHEEWVAVALSSAHPEPLAGRAVTRPYRSFPDHRLRLIRVRLDGGGEVETLYEYDRAGSAHCAFSPADPTLLYFDLDTPPGYWCGGDGTTPRVWLLDIPSGRAWPLRDEPGIFPVCTPPGCGTAPHWPTTGGCRAAGSTSPSPARTG